MFPIRYDTAWRFYKKAVASSWIVEEVDMTEDKHHFQKLSANEQHFIKMVLAFFAGSDGIVIENLGVRFMNEIQVPEIRAFYAFQISIETIHSETYSLMIDVLVDNPEEKAHLFKAVDTVPSIAKKAQWASKWIEDERADFATRLVAFACVEGIFFSGSFAAIFWLKKRGLLPGLSFANELISRDEGLHCQFACHLYTDLLVNKLNQTRIEQIVTEAVNLEIEFLCESLPVSLIGMNAAQMIEYIQFVADHLVLSLGHDRVYHSKNPFPFMEQISLEGKANFFEKRNGSYIRSNVMTSLTDRMPRVFSMEEDF